MNNIDQIDAEMHFENIVTSLRTFHKPIKTTL